MAEALPEASASLDAELGSRPLVRAHVRVILGGSFRALGQLEQARRELVEGHRLRVEHLGPRHPETAAATNALAVLRLQEGDHEGACQLLQQVLEIYRETVGYDNPNTCATLINLSSAYRSRGDDQIALETLVEAERVARSVLGEDHVQVAYCLSHRAELARRLEGDAIAEALCRAALDLYLGIHGERHLEVAHEQLRLAEILMARGASTSEAEMLCRSAIETYRAFHATPRPELGEALERLGRLLIADGRNEQAVPALRDAVEVTRGFAEPEAIALGVRCHLYGSVLRRLGRDEDALAVLEEAAGIYAASEPRDVNRVSIHRGLASLHERRGRHREARRELERALELFARVEPPEGRTKSVSYSLRGHLAALLLQLGEFELAEAGYRALLDEGGPSEDRIRHNLALALSSLGRHAEAEAIFRRLLDDRIAASGPDAASLAVLHYSLGRLLVDTDRFIEAEQQLERARSLWSGEDGDESPNALLAAAAVADVERRLGRRDDAERTYRSIAGPFAEAFPAGHWRHDAFAGAQAALVYELHHDSAAAERLRIAHAALVAKLGHEHREARFLEQRQEELDLGR